MPPFRCRAGLLLAAHHSCNHTAHLNAEKKRRGHRNNQEYYSRHPLATSHSELTTQNELVQATAPAHSEASAAPCHSTCVLPWPCPSVQDPWPPRQKLAQPKPCYVATTSPVPAASAIAGWQRCIQLPLGRRRARGGSAPPGGGQVAGPSWWHALRHNAKTNARPRAHREPQASRTSAHCQVATQAAMVVSEATGRQGTGEPAKGARC